MIAHMPSTILGNRMISLNQMKQDFFSSNNIKHVDYKDTDILKKFLSPNAKIMSRRRTGLSANNQRKVALAVKRSRFMGLIPYIAK